MHSVSIASLGSIYFLFLSSNAFAGEIALSFDDAPRRTTSYLKGSERETRLIQALKDAKVDQVIFFSTTQGLRYPKRRARLQAYADAGHLIANHTHTHSHPDKIGTQKYMADVRLAPKKLKDFKNFVPIFRYPFLDYGRTIASRDFIRNELKALGYTNGYVTVDNADWYMDSVFQKAIQAGKKVDLESLKKAYVDALWDSILFYDGLAKNILGRSPKHVLLLHENDLAALFVKDLVEHIRSKGWKIITPTIAYKDPIASMTPPETLINNDGRIAAIAHARGYKGKKRDFFQSKKEVDRLFAKAFK